MLSPKNNSPNFNILNWLRGLAALYVTVAHCRTWLYAGGEYFQALHPRETWLAGDYVFHAAILLTRMSTEVVVLFFLISGFSIAYSLSAGSSVKRFYIRRVIRIYPPYLLGLAWAALVFIIALKLTPVLFSCSIPTFLFDGLCHSKDFLSPGKILSNILFIPYGSFISQFWSITFEVIFYVLVPAFMLNRQLYFLLSTVAYIISWFAFGWKFDTSEVLKTYFFHINFYFALGVFLYTHFDKIKATLPAKNTFYMALLPVLLASIIALNIYFGSATKISGAFAALFSFLFIYRMLDKNVVIKPLACIGKFSYSLYITHVATILLFMSLSNYFFHTQLPILSHWLWLLAIPVCLCVAWSAWWLVERNDTKMKNYFS